MAILNLSKNQKKKTGTDLINAFNASNKSTPKITPKSNVKNSEAYKTVSNTLTNLLGKAANKLISASSSKTSSSSSSHGGGGRRLLDDGSSVDLKTGEKISAPTSTESVADILRSNYPTLSGGGSSYSGNDAGMIDISNLLKAYDDAAAANKAIVEQSYNTQRGDLLTSLKRFQEQNAKDVEAQRKTYLSNQALLESAIAEADRNNRINAAARGLGGSGLQQLSQLQTLLSQGQTISDMATENQDVVNNLREVLANYDEDTKTALSNLEKTRENSLKGIESDLGMNKANIEYQAREAAANRAQMEASTNAQIAAQNAQYEAEAKAQERALNSEIATLNTNYQKQLDDIKNMSNKEIKKYFKTAIDEGANIKDYNTAKTYLYNSYHDLMGTTLNNYLVGGTSFANTQYQNLKDLYNAAESTYVKPTSALTQAANNSLLGRNLSVQNSLVGNLFNKATGTKSISNFLRT